MVIKKLIALTLLGFTEAGQCMFTSDSQWTKVGLTNPKFGWNGNVIGLYEKPSKPWFNHPYQTFRPGNAVDGNLETYAMGTNTSPNPTFWYDYMDSRFYVHMKRKCIPREVVIYPRQCGGYEQYEKMYVHTGMEVTCYPSAKFDSAFVQNNLHTGLIFKCSNKTSGFKRSVQPPADTDFVVVGVNCRSLGRAFPTPSGRCDYKVQIAEIEVFCE